MSRPAPILPYATEEAQIAPPVTRKADAAMEDRALDTASTSTLSSALDRIEELLREETEALQTRTAIDFAEISRRKSRSLLELSRIARAVPPRLDPATAVRVRNLRETLQKNLDLLGVHLAAAQEVSAIMHSAIREAESDGTYSNSLAYGRALL